MMTSTCSNLGAVSWRIEQSGTTDAGLKELNAVVGRGHGFDTVKPLMLFQKIIQLWCPADRAGDGPVRWVRDDRTCRARAQRRTLARARRFILIEQGRPERGDSYASSLTANRLKRVVIGDWASGKQRAARRRDFRSSGLISGSMRKRFSAMERDEMVDTVIASHFDANRKRGSNLIRVNGRERRYLVAKNSEDEGFFLVWDGPDKNTDFNASVYDACATEAEEAGLKPIYHVYARLYLYQTENVRFYQIPRSHPRRLRPGHEQRAVHGAFVIELYEFQQQAAATMAERFSRYIADPVITGTRQHQHAVPVFPGTCINHGVRQDGHTRRRGVVHRGCASRPSHRSLALQGQGCRRADARQPSARRQVPPPSGEC